MELYCPALCSSTHGFSAGNVEHGECAAFLPCSHLSPHHYWPRGLKRRAQTCCHVCFFLVKYAARWRQCQRPHGRRCATVRARGRNGGSARGEDKTTEGVGTLVHRGAAQHELATVAPHECACGCLEFFRFLYFISAQVVDPLLFSYHSGRRLRSRHSDMSRRSKRIKKYVRLNITPSPMYRFPPVLDGLDDSPNLPCRCNSRTTKKSRFTISPLAPYTRSRPFPTGVSASFPAS